MQLTSIFNTPLRRGYFIALLVGLFVLGYGVFDWLGAYDHHVLRRTSHIPEYPPDDVVFHSSFVQVHRSCEWTFQRPSGDPLDRDGPIVTADTVFSVDIACAKPLLPAPASGETLITPITLRSIGKQSGHVMFRRYLAERDWFSTEPLKSERQLYTEWVFGDVGRARLAENVLAKVADQCIMAEPRWCIESQKLVRTSFWPIISSSAVIAVGSVLAILGFIGAFLFTPAAWLWRITARRLWQWVRSGK